MGMLKYKLPLIVIVAP